MNVLLNTKLKLLVDECVPGPLVDGIRTCSGLRNVEIIDANHQLGNKSTPDDEVVAYAKKTGRIVLTVEGRLNEKRFPVCSHPGIIVIKATCMPKIDRVEQFRSFMKSGHRKKCLHAVTKFQSQNEAVIIARDESKNLSETVVTF